MAMLCSTPGVSRSVPRDLKQSKPVGHELRLVHCHLKTMKNALRVVRNCHLFKENQCQARRKNTTPLKTHEESSELRKTMANLLWFVSVQNSSCLCKTAPLPHAQLCESSVEQALLYTETGGTRIAKPQKTWNKRCIVAIAVWLWSGHEKTTWKLIQQPRRKQLQKWLWDSMGMNATCVASMAICRLNGAIFDLSPLSRNITQLLITTPASWDMGRRCHEF
jgi:hypothetical protein